MYPETHLVRKNFGQDNDLFCEQVPPKLHEIFSFVDSLVIRDQIIYQNHKELDKFKNSHILVLGGGPSTNNIDWNPLEYDYIWSMSHCFYNSKVFKVGVEFLTIGCGVDLTGEDFNRFLNIHKPLIGFELHVKYYRPGTKRIQNVEAANICYRNDLKMCYQTKWYSQLGTGARQLILAASLAPKKITFLGFDGPQAIYDKNHSFVAENDPRGEGVHKLPGSIRHLPRHQVFEHFKYEYSVFWIYMKKQFPNVVFESLDKENIYHQESL
jgi:hypothetical protein